jgi:hypothetical protein
VRLPHSHENYYYHKKKKRAGGVAEVVESLPSKHKALSSNPSTSKKKQKDKKSSADKDVEKLKALWMLLEGPLWKTLRKQIAI